MYEEFIDKVNKKEAVLIRNWNLAGKGYSFNKEESKVKAFERKLIYKEIVKEMSFEEEKQLTEF